MGNVSSWIPSWLIDYDAFEQTTNVSFSNIEFTAAASALCGASFYLYWTIKRWNDPGYFAPKRLEKPELLPGPQEGLFSWVHSLIKLKEKDFLKFAGYDAYIYIRMYILAAKISITVGIYAFLIVLPVNIAGADLVEGDSDFYSWSVSNVPSSSPVLWVHAIGTLLLTVAAFIFLNREFSVYTRLRHSYLKLRAPHLRTIMLENVPEEMRSAAQIFVYFDHLYPQSVSSVSCIQDLRSLGKLIDKREVTVRVLERLLLYRSRTDSHRAKTISFLEKICCVESLDNRILKYQNLLDELNVKIRNEQNNQMQLLRKIDKKVLREIEMGGHLSKQIMSPRVSGSSSGATLSRSDVEDYLKKLGAKLGIGEASSDSSRVWPENIEMYFGDDEFSTETFGLSERMCSLARTISAIFRTTTKYGSLNEGERRLLLPPLANSREHKMAKIGSRAFVTFNTFAGATIARQVHHASRVGAFKVMEAPEPRDIYWSKGHISPFQRKLRKILVDTFLLLLYLFWVVPVTLLYLILSEDALISRFEWFATFCRLTSWFCSMIGTVQPIVILALMNLLPPLVRQLGKFQGSEAESWNQKQVLSRYFIFQIVNVFLVTTIAGTIFDTLSLIVDSPKTVLTLLGQSLPKVCGFFCEVIIIKFLCGLFIELSRFFSLLQHYIFIMIWPSETKRDRRMEILGTRHYEDPGYFNLPKYMAQDLLLVTITFTFACINPFILVVSIPFYFAAHIVYKHQMLYVYEPMFETGGTFYPKIFRRFIFAVFMSQATMAGVLILKEAYYQAAAIVVLMFITWIFKRQQREYYEPVSNTLPLEMATLLDAECEEELTRFDWPDASSYFVQPELKAPATVTPELQ